MEITKVQFGVGNEVLAGSIVRDNKFSKPRLLFIHGAGQATKERARELALKLAEHHISSFGFDFSGHGESTGEIGKSSLSKRTQEAREALKFLNSEEPITLCAFSMGGHIALELLRTEPISNLLLFYPAVYTKEAFEVPFESGFSEIIRREESWRETDVLEDLAAFSGNLFICIGEMDQVIPRDVIRMLDETSRNAKKKEIMIIPGVNHQLIQWLSINQDAMDMMIKKILYFIS